MFQPCLEHRCNGTDKGDEDDDADEGDDETSDGQTARCSKHTDKGEDDTEQPENPVEDGNPAEDEADEGENETGGANTILLRGRGRLDEYLLLGCLLIFHDD